LKQLNSLSNNFIAEIIRISGGFVSAEEMDIFFNSLESELRKYYFTTSAENNLLRIINSFINKSSLIKDAGKYPHYTEILLSTSVNSNYLTDILVRDPEYFYWIANPANLNSKLVKEEFLKSVPELISRYRSFKAKLNALKSLKRKEILRIGMQDLLGISSLSEITGQLSVLASGLLDGLFTLCNNEISSKYKLNFSNVYCMISLGKLGGWELNYSSDTDLMIFYDKDKKYGSRYYSEYLTETIILFIESSSQLTDNGYLYRIDFRLRPDGKNSPLCRSLPEYLSYYETRGESWERQMLIKAEYLSGDEDLYRKFRKYLDPYIYPLTQTTSPAEQVMKMKNSIEKSLKHDLNIKLTKGGIRDIEFVVQVLQLLNGGKNFLLKQQNTLNAVNALAEAGLISEDEKEILVRAYIFYRRTEHYLQLMNDRQIHTIPEAGEIVDKMAYYIGFKNRKIFLEHLNETRDKVRSIYLSFIPAEAGGPLKNLIFKNTQQAERDLEYLREGKAVTGSKSFDKNTQNKFSLLEPYLQDILKSLPDPDLALRNFTFFIQSTTIPSIWFNEFLDKTFLDYFLRICMYGKKAVMLLSNEPELQDFLLSRKVFSEYKMEEINSFSLKKMLFYISVKFILNKMHAQEFSEVLSRYCLNVVKVISERSFGKKKYFVAAMGSLGSGEMTYASDLDLIFVSSGVNETVEKKFRNLLGEINKEIIYFKADCRLRPEGEGSQLAWDIASYKKYIISRARVWELQALTKLKFIAGERGIFGQLVTTVKERLKKEECSFIKSSVLDMREKMNASGLSQYSKNFHMKKSSGGLTDIEFIIQYLILCNINFFSNCSGKNLPEMVNTIVSSSDKYNDLLQLSESFNFLHSTGILIQSVFDTDKIYFPGDETSRNIIASFYGISAEELDDKKEQTLKINQLLFDRYFK
jgi:[glutamine synthetase] adenylyltransferase / [glutamine synthetase]-adenylyl-L-tyrosine phosphorylase